MELLRAVLLALLLSATTRPTKVSCGRVVMPNSDPTTGHDLTPVRLDGQEDFNSQVQVILADEARLGSSLFGVRTTLKYNPNAWQGLRACQKGHFSSLACTVPAGVDVERHIKLSTRFGYSLGFKSIVVSSEYISVQRKARSYFSPIKRLNAKDFVSIKAFKKIASGSPDPNVELGEKGWAAGLCQDTKSSQVTLISMGPVGLHFILMEEDPDAGLLKPCYIMAEADARRVIQLRKTPDGSRLRNYYLLVAEEAFLKHAVDFAPPVPRRLSDMKTIIEAGSQKIWRHSPPPILLLVNLQEELPQDEEGEAAAVPVAQADDGEEPERLGTLQPGLVQSYGSIETARSGGWMLRPPSRVKLSMFLDPQEESCFERFGSTMTSFGIIKNYSTRGYGFTLESDGILFSSGLARPTRGLQSVGKQGAHLDFRTKGGFRRGAKISGGGSAIGDRRSV